MDNKLGTELLNGYQGAVRGAMEAGAEFIGVAYSIPPKPFEGATIYHSSFSVLSAAFGAALSGKRAFCFLEELTVEELACYSLCGVNGALVILFCEDNEYLKWNVREIFKSAHFPVLEPSDPSEIKRFVKIAFNMSEKYDVPVIVRASVANLLSMCDVDIYAPKTIKDRAYKKDATKYVLLPATIKLCEDDVCERDRRLKKDGETFPIHTEEHRGEDVGVVACGEQAALAAAALSEASILKLGSSFPLPVEKIKAFAQKVKKLYVVEEFPYIELELIKQGVKCFGAACFPREGRKSVADIQTYIGHSAFTAENGLPVRAPDFCYDCPYLPVFFSLKNKGKTVFTSVGCTSLGGSFVAVNEVSVARPIAAAIAFSSPSYAIVNEWELLKESDALSKLKESSATVIVLKNGDVFDVVKVVDAFGIKAEIIKDAMPENYVEKLYVYENARCKYAK